MENTNNPPPGPIPTLALATANALASAGAGNWGVECHRYGNDDRYVHSATLRRESDSLPLYLITTQKGKERRLSVYLAPLDTNDRGRQIRACDVRDPGPAGGYLSDGEITLALDTPPQKVAAAIQRRLLPHAEKVWPLVLAEAKSRADHKQATQNTVAALKAAGFVFSPHGEAKEEPSFCGPSGVYFYGRVNGDRVTVERLESVSAAQAIAIARTINPSATK